MNSAKYRELQAVQVTDFPLFHQAWWLDIACGGSDHWRGIVTESAFKGSHALMPVPLLPKWRILPTVRRPPLTPYLGPWSANLPQLNDRVQFQLARQLWPVLIEQLPRVPYFQQTFRPEVIHALPFHGAGYRLQARYSYRLPAGSLNFNRNNRRALARASELTVWTSPTTQVLYDLLHTALERQGSRSSLSASLMENLHQAAAQRGQSEIWLVGAQQDRPQAAIWVLWDAFCIYVLSNGVNSEGRQNGAYPKLIAHLLEHPPVAGLPIDLCGTMLPAVAEVNVGLGAEAQLLIELKRNWLT